MIIRLDVDWARPPGGTEQDGRALGWGNAVLYVCDTPVWFRGPVDSPEPIAWSWIELLEFLAANFAFLKGEQVYPLGLTPATPRNLRRKAKKRWGDHIPFTEDEEIFRFEGRHDLARGLRGISLPSVLVFREGDMAWISTDAKDEYVSQEHLFAGLENLGQMIAAQLQGSLDSRAGKALEAWDRRAYCNSDRLIRIATGLDPDVFADQAELKRLDFWELDATVGADSELAAAARLFGGATATMRDIAEALAVVRNQPPAPVQALDELARRLQPVLAEKQTEDPFRQGYALAGAARGELQLGRGRVEPEGVLLKLGIPLVEIHLSRIVDAVGCWGPRHGPAVLLNSVGQRAATLHGRRATVAHELCHLLVDRKSALPLAEVLGGRSPYVPERRANAFAAEFLLPRSEIREAYDRHKALKPTMDALCSDFGVGVVLCANQILHTKYVELTTDEHRRLKQMVAQEDQLDQDDWD